jgi:hypothetical protein
MSTTEEVKRKCRIAKSCPRLIVAYKRAGESRKARGMGRGWMTEGVVIMLRWYRLFRVKLMLVYRSI